MIAFSCAGRSHAICSELNPEYDVPYIPMFPSHQAWSASQSITDGQVLLLAGRVLVGRVATRRAGAAQVEATDGVPVLVAEPDVLGRGTTT